MKDCTNCGHKIEGYALCPIVDECDDVLSKWIPQPTIDFVEEEWGDVLRQLGEEKRYVLMGPGDNLYYAKGGFRLIEGNPIEWLQKHAHEDCKELGLPEITQSDTTGAEGEIDPTTHFVCDSCGEPTRIENRERSMDGDFCCKCVIERLRKHIESESQDKHDKETNILQPGDIDCPHNDLSVCTLMHPNCQMLLDGDGCPRELEEESLSSSEPPEEKGPGKEELQCRDCPYYEPDGNPMCSFKNTERFCDIFNELRKKGYEVIIRKSESPLEESGKEKEDCEHCQRCGIAYMEIYAAPYDVWEKISEGRNLLCMNCCDELARKNGIYLYWSSQVGDFPKIVDKGSEEDTPKNELELMQSVHKIDMEALDIIDKKVKDAKKKVKL